jgi:DNA-binding winged helix-turn-helix (wHTH) protein
LRPARQLRFASFRLDAVNACLWRGTRTVRLTPKAFAVLQWLVERPGELITKDALLEAVWPATVVGDAVLKVCVREIRKALGDRAGAPRYIATVHRLGYRFIADVADAPDPRRAAGEPPTLSPPALGPRARSDGGGHVVGFCSFRI